MNPFQPTDAEWLAHEALEHAQSNTAVAVDRLRGAVSVLLLWQRCVLFDAPPGPSEPARG